MKSSSWISAAALTVATVSLALAGEAGCGSEESGKKGGVLDGGGAGGGGGLYVPGHSTVLGAACEADGDCTDGLTCVSSTSAALADGSPAHGICTAPCVPGQFTCKEIDADASCVAFTSSTAYCLEACKFGAPTFGEIKCHSRAEMACTEVADFEFEGATCVTDAECGQGYGCELGRCAQLCQADGQCPQGSACEQGICAVVRAACMPQCNGDADCDSGQHCDFEPAIARHGHGLCRPNPPTGLETGAACDPQSQVAACRGVCVPFSDTVGMCMDGCTVGASLSCSWSGTGPADAACFPGYPGDSTGDSGLCRELCDCNGDCTNQAMVCSPFPVGASEATKYTRRGYCTIEAAAGAGGTPELPCNAGGSSAGGAGGTAGAGG